MVRQQLLGVFGQTVAAVAKARVVVAGANARLQAHVVDDVADIKANQRQQSWNRNEIRNQDGSCRQDKDRNNEALPNRASEPRPFPRFGSILTILTTMVRMVIYMQNEILQFLAEHPSTARKEMQTPFRRNRSTACRILREMVDKRGGNRGGR